MVRGKHHELSDGLAAERNRRVCKIAPRDVEAGRASGDFAHAVGRSDPLLPNGPWISPRSPPQSAGNKPLLTYRWKLLYGQSQTRVA